jgi:DNA-directed RNA polymerase subunit RPC12/RpoP
MVIKCSTCGERVSVGWLFLGLPWSKYTCVRCGSVVGGTLVRLVMISISTGLLGYVLFGAIKGRINILWLPLPLVLTLVILFLDLPMQIKKDDQPAKRSDTGSA